MWSHKWRNIVLFTVGTIEGKINRNQRQQIDGKCEFARGRMTSTPTAIFIRAVCCFWGCWFLFCLYVSIIYCHHQKALQVYQCLLRIRRMHDTKSIAPPKITIFVAFEIQSTSSVWLGIHEQHGKKQNLNSTWHARRTQSHPSTDTSKTNGLERKNEQTCGRYSKTKICTMKLKMMNGFASDNSKRRSTLTHTHTHKMPSVIYY